MPHSPRWHQGRLWLHNSGTGEFGSVDLRTGRFEPLCFCPGYLRGLDFIDGFAVMGLSRPRENRTFSGLALDAQLSARRMEPRCGIYVVALYSAPLLIPSRSRASLPSFTMSPFCPACCSLPPLAPTAPSWRA